MTSGPSFDLKQEILERVSDFTPWFRDVKDTRASGNGGWISGRCPLHDDAHSSFSFDPASGGWKCFAGCGQGDVFSYLIQLRNEDFISVLRGIGKDVGINVDSQPRKSVDLDEMRARAVAHLQREPERRAWLRDHRGLTEDSLTRFGIGWNREDGRYTIPVQDASGVTVNLRRYGPGKKNKMLNVAGCGSPARLLGCDELKLNPGSSVVLCEGEWDCLLLRQHGFLAVTGTAGVNHFSSDWLAFLRDRDVAIVFDCDEPGISGAEKVARQLAQGGATSVKVIRLPLDGTPEDKDVTDFFLRHRAAPEDLRRLIATTPLYALEATFPQIRVNDRQPRDVAADAWRALHASNDPPRLFVQGGSVIRLGINVGIPRADSVSEPYMRTVLNSVANWVKVARSGSLSAAKPPRELASEMLARPDDELPPLDGIVATPVYWADGQLAASAGYDRGSRLWIHLGPELKGLQIDGSPTKEALAAARRLIVEDLFLDFPFAEQPDRAHAVAALVLPLIRRMVPGCTPLHLLEGSTPGAGKTLAADLVSIVATGKPCEATTITNNEEDLRKKTTSLLMRGAPIVLIDNVKNELDSAQLACALTAETWSDRLLGGNRIVDLPNLSVWLVTANNPRLSEEMVRRTVRIRLEPLEERPWERRHFKHQHIRKWACENRAQLVGAVLTLVQAWLNSGKPMSQATMGSFETWSQIMGGILEVAGIPGFLEGRDRFYENADTEGQQWRAFVETWHQEHGQREVTVTHLLRLAEQRDLIPFATVGQSPQAQRVKLAKALSQIRDRRYGNVCVRASMDRHSKTRSYQLCPVQDSRAGERSTA